MTAAKPNIPFTYDDYQTLPEDMSRRYELLNGDLFLVPAPTTRHQRIARILFSIVNDQVCSNELGEVFFAPIDVILGVGEGREVVQPDIVFIAEARCAIIQIHGIEGAPDLAVEILSSRTQDRDRGYKRTLYARHGIVEYWIVDPDERSIEVYRVGSEGYGLLSKFHADEVLTSAMFPGLNIPLRDIFQR
jgi:Uma2 family endonuclease